jgi:hypothetical protein
MPFARIELSPEPTSSVIPYRAHHPTKTRTVLVSQVGRRLKANVDALISVRHSQQISILPKRAGLRTVVAAMAADPPVTATVRRAVHMEMSCRVKPPPAVFVSMTVAVEAGGMEFSGLTRRGCSFQKVRWSAICRNRGLPIVCWITPSCPPGGLHRYAKPRAAPPQDWSAWPALGA